MNPHEWLANELAQKRASNPRYSLRLFALKLGFAPGRLSEYISGKRALSFKQAEKIADRLGYDAETRVAFFNSVAPQTKASKKEAPEVERKLSDESYRKLTADAFSVIADWQHFAILSLMDVEGFKMDEEWIGSRLGISTRDVRFAIAKLEHVKLIERRNGKWRKIENDHSTTHDVPSAALKISHRQSLSQAIDAIDEIPVEFRDITSITMAVDPATLPEAKKLIKNFRRRLSALMESGTQTEVYNLNVQLVPVTKLKNLKSKNTKVPRDN